MSEDNKIEVKKETTQNKNKEESKTHELSVRREHPFSLFQEMDRFFDDLSRNFFNDWYWPFGGRRKPGLSIVFSDNEPIFRTPLANIKADDNFFNITAELPGLEKGDLEITIQDGNLEIKGEVKEESKEEKDGQLIRREYHSSKYYRCFNLPENINEDKIEAKLDKGLLTVKIPKIEPSMPEKKKIDIK